jgi:hypothetical protein
MTTRRGALLGAGVLLAIGTARADAVLPASASLVADAAAAVRSGKALVVLVNLEGCPYCHAVRRAYLAPLREQGQPVVQVELKDMRQMGIRMAPTVLFLGPGGREVAPRLVGYSSPDFYGAYLDERVQTANAAAAR